MKLRVIKPIFYFVLLGLVSCSNDSGVSNIEASDLNEQTTGSGFFNFTAYQPFLEKPIKVYYYIPENINANTPLLFIFHGTGRNARDYRDAVISKANQYNFIVMAPEFSNSYFPGGDGYNLGNVFIDGDNPSPTNLNPEDQWTFSVIEPMFDFVKASINNSTNKYHVFGHSAGGQFAHRFIMFKPNSRFDKVVASASGWYTVPDFEVDFPYGFKNSPLENLSLSTLFNNNLIIQIGSLDNDPNATALRHNSFADVQGLNRFARTNYFFDKAQNLALSNSLNFNWQFYINENLGHDFQSAIENAADIIFN
jgi:pimeloyl-ACP methyl ester carboxylesterase